MQARQHKARVTAVKQLSPAVKGITVQVGEKNFHFLPGQFVMAAQEEYPSVSRAYSIAAAQDNNHIELCIKILEKGALSSALNKIKEGDQLLIDGPYGKFVLQEAQEDLIFIAGGTGIAPIRAMLQALWKQGKKNEMWLFYRFKEQESYLYREEWEAAAQERKNFHLIPSTRGSSQWKGETDRPQLLLKKYIATPEGKEVYVCGSPEMVREISADLLDQGFTREQLHREMW